MKKDYTEPEIEVYLFSDTSEKVFVDTSPQDPNGPGWSKDIL